MFFTDYFADVPEPRNFTARHLLTDVLFSALVATLCGARNCTEMAYFAETKLELLRCFITAFKPSGKNALIGLKYLGRVEAWRTVGAETTYRVRDYALSKRIPQDELLKLSRDHSPETTGASKTGFTGSAT